MVGFCVLLYAKPASMANNFATVNSNSTERTMTNIWEYNMVEAAGKLIGIIKPKFVPSDRCDDDDDGWNCVK